MKALLRIVGPALLTAMLLVPGCGRPKATISIVNGLGNYDITSIYVYPDSVLLRGASLLNSPLLPGDTFEARVYPGIYTVVLIDEDGDSYNYGGLLVGRTGYALRAQLEDLNMGTIHSGQGGTPVVIVNALESNSIYYAYASMTAGAWGGADLLRSTVMLPGEKLIYWTVPGTWSFKLVDDAGAEYIEEDIQVGDSGYVWTVTGADRGTGF
jgi:hypothetical protein